jgi:hypothetical protein
MDATDQSLTAPTTPTTQKSKGVKSLETSRRESSSPPSIQGKMKITFKFEIKKKYIYTMFRATTTTTTGCCVCQWL